MCIYIYIYIYTHVPLDHGRQLARHLQGGVFMIANNTIIGWTIISISISISVNSSTNSIKQYCYQYGYHFE